MTGAIRESYEKHHREGGRYGFTFGSQARLAFFDRALPGACTILDLGSRDGTLLGRLQRPGRRFVGLDIDGVALARASAVPQVSVALANLWSGLPIRSGSVDAVLAGEFLEHTPDPWLVAREVARVLTPRGVFVGSVPNASRLRNRIRFLAGRTVEVDRTHLHSFSPELLSECLRDAGFVATIEFLESRMLRLHPRLMGNTMVFRAVRA